MSRRPDRSGNTPAAIRVIGFVPGRFHLSFLVAAILTASPAFGAGWERFEVPETGQRVWRYVPATVVEPAPVVVFLHGAGASPDMWRSLVQPVADETGAVVLLPKSGSDLGWGPGRDRETIEGALALTAEALSIDPFRISIGGHSSGGAYAMVLGYAARTRFAGVFAIGAPYRTILEVADPGYTAPLRLAYGSNDPNYTGGSRAALEEMLDRLGVPRTLDVLPGAGHGDIPHEALVEGFRFLLDQRYPGLCRTDDTGLCLQNRRFRVTGTWRTEAGTNGLARPVVGEAEDSGLLWFFSPANWEVQVKILDGCAINGHYWVYLAASTDVELTLTVTDLMTDRTETYGNVLGEPARARGDVEAFPCGG